MAALRNPKVVPDRPSGSWIARLLQQLPEGELPAEVQAEVHRLKLRLLRKEL